MGLNVTAAIVLVPEPNQPPLDPNDAFDPRNWDRLIDAEYEYRIYADDNASEYCVVDREDWEFFSQWRWHVNKPHPRRAGKKRYLTRSTSNGRRPGPKLYLHVEIMRRAGKKPPTPKQKYVDHCDGDEMNCRKYNLEYVTQRENLRRSVVQRRKRVRALLELTYA